MNPTGDPLDKNGNCLEFRELWKKDKQLNILISVFVGVVVFAVLILGYIAIFKQPDYMTRQQTRELVDSILTEIYD